MSMKPRVVQLVGYSDSGKTTLLSRLIPLLQRQGLRVGVVKHDGGHDFELDQPGKDTWRYREAGASLVAISSQTKTAFIEQQPLPLEQIVARMGQAGADLVLVEGFKREHYPKLVLIRKPQDRELLAAVTNVVAIVTWDEWEHGGLPVFHVDDAQAIASFVQKGE
ncbi:molybdopterin-guanine dinucleotide biosynthesis protein B [Brevibacillus sp. TJ4]|uniref:molybdopterin-guanine dinucleotide biosynthesis protein B n=1 Tax=Brevibacillus sp. TJ4 TaxID=3234853 RepID=UPI0037DCC8B3